MITKVKIDAVQGENRAVESKSDAHRALICAALCKGKTDISLAASNDDIKATARCLEAMGASVIRTETGYSVTGGLGKEEAILDCGESGSTARFLLPIAAVLGKNTKLVGTGKLPTRPMLPLTELLRGKGSCISDDHLPLTVQGKAEGGRFEIDGSVSSQFISGLLMALPLTECGGSIALTSPLQSELYADMTVKTLGAFGVNWKKICMGAEGYPFGGYTLEGGRYQTKAAYTVEGDWSGAAFFVVLAALKGEISIYGLDENSLQPDKAVLDAVRSAGAYAEFDGGVLKVRKREIKPINVDVSQCPDIFPILAVLACGAKGESLLYNAGRLRIKESDRIETTAALIRALGGKVEIGQDSMRVLGSGMLCGGTIDGAADHRIVMSAAVASALCNDEVQIIGSEAVSKSYPSFFEALEKVGGKVR